MDQLQAELASSQPLLDIEILGVNWTGLESANAEAVENKSLPWLQDVDSDSDGASDVWVDWGAEHLDLIMRDAHNGPLGFINLIQTSLSEPTNYSFLRDLLIDAAMEGQKPWHNADNPLDINHDGSIIPQDVLIIVNRLNSLGVQKLPPPGVQAPQMFYDSNADGDSTPLDALLVINYLNEQSGAGTGEAEAVSLDALPILAADVVIPSLSQPSGETAEGNAKSTLNSESTDDRTDWQRPSNLAMHHSAHADNADQVFRQEMMDWSIHHESHDLAEMDWREGHNRRVERSISF